MLYRPKFCCNCGEKIERSEWRLTDSRRFCPLCETEYKGADYVPRAIVIAGLVLSVFGFKGMFADAGGGPAARPASAMHAGPAPRSSPVAAKDAPPLREHQAVSATNAAQAREKFDEQPSNAAASSETRSYYCGALTKKGTPCSRRVKAKGTRCWQHADRTE